jgi:hypothetical protein
MSDQNDHSVTARLVQRLAMPGVLDRTPVEHRYERLQQGTVKHELTERLSQRATASGEAGGSSFVWRRSAAAADASAEGLTMPAILTSVPVVTTSVPAASSAPVSAASSPLIQRATLPGAESAAVTARLVSRAQSSGILAVGSTISRPAEPGSFSNAPVFAADLQSRYGVTSSDVAAAAAPVQAASALSISRAPAGVIRRQVDAPNSTASPSRHDNASVVPVSSPASPGSGTAPMLARKALAASAMGSTLPLAPLGGNGSPAAPDSRPGGSSQATGIPMMPAARPLLSPGQEAGAPLVLRRMLAAPAQSSTPLPAVMPPATVHLPREETPAPSQQKSGPAVAMKVGTHADSDIDRIAEEVGRRLMRRLEIERERKGIRQWR